MKKLLVIICLIGGIHSDVFTQDNGIGFNLKYNDFSGLGSELRYERNLSERWLIGASVASNFHGNLSLRGGFKHRIAQAGRVSFLAGLDYNIRFAKLAGESSTKTYRAFEIPLDIRIGISGDYQLLLGSALVFPVDSYSNKDYLLNNLRLGVIRKF